MTIDSLNLVSHLLNYSECAEYLGVKETTLRIWVSQGKVPYTKIGRSVRFTSEQVNEILENGRHEATARCINEKNN